MSPGQPNTKPDRAELEAAIDALLTEINTTCTKFENPQAAEEDEDLAEYTKAMAGVAPAATQVAPPPTVASPTTLTPDTPPPIKPTADVTDGPALAGAEADAAIDEAEATTDDLLEAAADQLIESLEAEVAGAEAESVARADASSNDELLEKALDGLLDGSVPAGAAVEPQVVPEVSAPEPVREPAAADAAAFADLDAAFDELLEGSFESASGEAIDTAGVDTRPDPSLMLDPTGRQQSSEEPLHAVSESAPSKGQEVSPEAASVSTPAESARAAVAPGVGPATNAVTVVPTGPAKPKAGKRVGALLGRVTVWARPRLAMLGGKLVAGLKPVGAKALLLMSKPLEGKPPSVRDSIGWVALWTLFLGLCVWGYAVLRPAPVPANDGRGTQVVTAETPAE